MHSRSTLNLALVATATLMLAGCATETGQSDAAADSSRTAQVTAKRDVVEHKLVRVRQRIAFARDTIKTSAILGALLTLFCVIVFHYGLSLQLPLFQWG